VPIWPTEPLDFGMTVAGPMARSVEDLALLYSVLAHEDVGVSTPPIAMSQTPLRVAWSGDPQGVTIDPTLAHALARVPEVLSAECLVEEAEPDLVEARSCLDPLRGRQYAVNYGHWLATAPEMLDPLVRANIEKGLADTDDVVAAAEQRRAVLIRRVREFFTRFDVLIVPGNVVVPFKAEHWTPDGGEGRQGTAYLDWLELYVRFSVLGVPVVLLPVGRTPDGVPVSVQLVAAPGRDVELLRIAQFVDSLLRADLSVA
jgi:amidase